jgi:hypothetical protein
MDKTAMVGFELGQGAEVVETLERANVKLNLAVWVVLSEYEDWRLVISSSHFDTPDPRDGYGRLFNLLRGAKIAAHRTPEIMILPTSDPFVRGLRRMFGKTKNVEGMRLGGQRFGDRFIQDAYVYRIS